MGDDRSSDAAAGEATSVRTFLIADLRGYTRYSDEHGDEAASALARRFAAIASDAVIARGGEVVELRGDEALCVFASARSAVRGSVELQRRARERAEGEPALPLGVGIGLDAGEAVATAGGYRGRALNVAARLCSLAKGGEILASETVAHLAGRDDGVRYAPRRPTAVKVLPSRSGSSRSSRRSSWLPRLLYLGRSSAITRGGERRSWWPPSSFSLRACL